MTPIAITGLVIVVTGLTMAFVGGLVLLTSLAEVDRLDRKEKNIPDPFEKGAYALDPFGIVVSLFYLIYLTRFFCWKKHGVSFLSCVAGFGAMLVGAILLLI